MEQDLKDSWNKRAYMAAMEIVFNSDKNELVDNIAEALLEFYNKGHNAGCITYKSVILNLLKEK